MTEIKANWEGLLAKTSPGHLISYLEGMFFDWDLPTKNITAIQYYHQVKLQKSHPVLVLTTIMQDIQLLIQALYFYARN